MTRISTTTKLLLLSAVSHLMLIPAFMYGEIWMFILSLVWFIFLTAFVSSGGHHRYYAHKSFKANKWYEYTVNALNIFTGGGPILTRAAMHRMHHALSDSEDDPSSPVHKGFMRIYLNAWGDNVRLDKRYFKGLIDNPILRFFHAHYFKMLFIIIAILLLIDPLLFIFAYCVPTVLSFHAWGAANSFLHRHGEPEHVKWISLVTAGEGDHKHHHLYPRDPNISKNFDLTYMLIKLIRTDK